MPRLTLTLPAEFGRPSRMGERPATERPPTKVGPGQRADDEATARTVRWFAEWAGK